MGHSPTGIGSNPYGQRDNMGMFDNMLKEPPKPLDVHRPVIVVWHAGEFRREKTCENMKKARAYAIRVIGHDDRMEVRLFDAKTKEKRGKVKLYAGVPYWQYNNTIKTLTIDGSCIKDMFDW